MTTIDERVAAGVAWLDEHRPGWWQRIQPDPPCPPDCTCGGTYRPAVGDAEAGGEVL